MFSFLLKCDFFPPTIYNFSIISNFFRKSTDPDLGSNFFLAANFARSSAAVMLRLRPLPVVVVVPLDGGAEVAVPLDGGGETLVPFDGGGEDGAIPLVRGAAVVCVEMIGTVGATIGLGDVGGEAEEEVTDGIYGSGSVSICGGGDLGNSGNFSDDALVMVTVDTLTTSSLVSTTSLVENVAVLTKEPLLWRWLWFLGLVENVDVLEGETVIGWETVSLLILMAIMSSPLVFDVSLVTTGELGVAA